MKKHVLVVYSDLADVEPYARAVEAAGAEPVRARAEPGLTLGTCDGLLLTGGGDVDPLLYGESPAPETEPPNPERDRAECALIDEALARDMPLFGICRGMQILNVRLGGSLVQHVAGVARHVRRTPERGLPAHTVEIEPGTLLEGIAQTPRWEVNSRHHQAIWKLGRGVRVSAKDAEDGTVEAIEVPSQRYVLAVQWHPENQVAAESGQPRLFQSFVRAL